MINLLSLIKYMMILKFQNFDMGKNLARFINENNIKKENIVSITQVHEGGYSIFYYGDAAVKEITHGLFS
jgi:hypothetical protein